MIRNLDERPDIGRFSCADGSETAQCVVKPVITYALSTFFLALMNRMSYLFVAITVLLTVYGQIIIKWQVLEVGALPADVSGKVRFVVDLLLNLWVLSALAAALLASVSWMLAMSKLPLSHAYPFVSLSFVLVLFLSYAAFSEPLTLPKVLGVALIVIGVAVSSQG